LDSLIALVKIEGNFLFDKATAAEFRSALINILGSDKGQVSCMYNDDVIVVR
jgi:hypothetical protein